MADVHEMEQVSPLIILDLEWNQRYGPQRGSAFSLPQEIVEIGAIKLDASFRIVDHLHCTVKPVVLPVAHHHVQRVTGISEAEWNNGIPFTEAYNLLRTFCTEHFTLCTWGPDDYPVLQKNIAYWMTPSDWLKRPLDAQHVYALLLGAGTAQQVALHTAMETLEVAQDLPPHRALHDAYHTARVWQKMQALVAALPQDDQRIKTLRTELGTHIHRPFQDRLYPTSCRSVEEALRQEPPFRILCPVCSAALTPSTERISTKPPGLLEQFGCCAEHGHVHARFMLQRTMRQSLTIHACYALADAQQAARFQQRHALPGVLPHKRRAGRKKNTTAGIPAVRPSPP